MTCCCKRPIIEINIFDFDYTLFDTPTQEDWENINQKKWINADFYAEPVSLLSPLKIKPIHDITNQLFLSSINPFILTIIMTGRIEPLRPYVKAILKKCGLICDHLFLCPPNEKVLDFKTRMIKNFIMENPSAKKIKIFDDRLLHLDSFERLCKGLGLITEIVPVWSEFGMKEFLNK